MSHTIIPVPVVQRLREFAKLPDPQIMVRPVRDEKTGLSDGTLRVIARQSDIVLLTTTRPEWEHGLRSAFEAEWLKARAAARSEA